MSTLGSVKSVPVQTVGSVPNGKVGHIGRNRISRCSIEGIAVEKYKSCGLGITFEDIQEQFRIKKRLALAIKIHVSLQSHLRLVPSRDCSARRYVSKELKYS